MSGFEIKEKGKEGRRKGGKEGGSGPLRLVGPPPKCRPTSPLPPCTPPSPSRLLLLLLPPSPGVVGAARLPAIQHGVERDGALAGPPLGNNGDDALLLLLLFTRSGNPSRR